MKVAPVKMVNYAYFNSSKSVDNRPRNCVREQPQVQKQVSFNGLGTYIDKLIHGSKGISTAQAIGSLVERAGDGTFVNKGRGFHELTEFTSRAFNGASEVIIKIQPKTVVLPMYEDGKSVINIWKTGFLRPSLVLDFLKTRVNKVIIFENENAYTLSLPKDSKSRKEAIEFVSESKQLAWQAETFELGLSDAPKLLIQDTFDMVKKARIEGFSLDLTFLSAFVKSPKPKEVLPLPKD